MGHDVPVADVTAVTVSGILPFGLIQSHLREVRICCTRNEYCSCLFYCNGMGFELKEMYRGKGMYGNGSESGKLNRNNNYGLCQLIHR